MSLKLNSTNTLDHLLEVLEEYDPDEIIDLLEPTSEELCEYLYDMIVAKKDKLLNHLSIYGADDCDEDEYPDEYLID